jgi:hypothetical protein
MRSFRLPQYRPYLSDSLLTRLLGDAREVPGVPGLTRLHSQAESLPGSLENPAALRFLARLWTELHPDLLRVLQLRERDRAFLDQRVRACHEFNRSLGLGIRDPDRRSPVGLEDGEGRIPFGPLRSDFWKAGGPGIAPLPPHLQGPHVTLFGPPDSARMAINAMNAFHRKVPGEPPVVGQLLARSGARPMWGADDEDSKTPLHADLIEAGANLTACFDGTLSLEEGGKRYELAKERLSLPIKRFPGLALPAPFLFFHDEAVPLHLYDFALHLHRNRARPEALTFYVPKLENEEEATYIHKMVGTAERLIREEDSTYRPGTVRLMIVLENPRALLRIHEIMDALHPYFAGASLGWHDFLASTARLLKEDADYRIPVKADPGIVLPVLSRLHSR